MKIIDTLETYQVAMSRYRQEHLDEVLAKYEFFATRNTTEKKIEEMKEEELKEIMWQIDGHESDEVAMERYREEHPEEVQAEYEFFAAWGTTKKKKSKVKNEDNVAPSTVIKQDVPTDLACHDASLWPIKSHMNITFGRDDSNTIAIESLL
jgi:hypothetical protein